MRSVFEYSFHHLPGTEEEIIYEIVDNILNTQDQIDELTRSIEKIDENSGLGLKQFNLKHSITKNISKINNLTLQIQDKEKQFENFKYKNNIKIKKLEDEINEKEKKIKDIYSKKGDIYKISYEKIEQIISKKKDIDELKNVSIEFNTTDHIERQIKNFLEENFMRKNEINERLLMLKEEKNSENENIINLISEKESLEEMTKIYLQNLNYTLNTSNGANTIINDKLSLSQSFSNNQEIEFDLFYFQICQIDINKCCIEITNNLSKFFFPNLLINDFNEEDIFISSKKNLLYNIIQNSLIDIINLNQNAISNNEIQILLKDLSKKIVSELKLNFPFQKILNVIKYIIKLNYLEIIINNNLIFLNKDYKQAKKDNKKKLIEIQAEINNLISKHDEIILKLSQIEERKKMLIGNTAKHTVNISPEEKEYISINEQINNLLRQKRELEDSLEKENHIYEMFNSDKKNEIIKLTKENKELESQIEFINSQIQIQNESKKIQIEKLKKDIKEKYKMIKTQLSIYKRKNGNNLELYDKFVSKINDCLKLPLKQIITDLNTSILPSPKLESKSFLFINNNLNKNRNVLRNNVLSQCQNSNSLSTKSIFTPAKFKSKLNIDYNTNNINNINNNISNNNNNNNNSLVTSNSSLSFFSPIKSRNPELTSHSSNKNIHHKHKNSDMNFNPKYKIINNESLWKNERSKLLKTIKSLREQMQSKENKEQILNDNKENDKIILLIRSVSCFFRLLTSKDNKFEPLIHSDLIDNFNYEKVLIKLNEKFTHFLIYKDGKINSKIPLNDIESTIVSNNMKYVIKIYQKYNQLNKKNELIDMDSFIKLDDFNNIPLDYNMRAKAAKNKYFNFSIIINIGNKKQRLEFVFNSYDEVKLWLNGFNYIIRQKNNKNNIGDSFSLRTIMKSK